MNHEEDVLDFMSSTEDIHNSFIDSLIFFTGRITRSDLVSRFGVGTATASRRLSEYVNKRSEWISSSSSLKGYISDWNQCSRHIESQSCDSSEAMLEYLAYGRINLSITSQGYGETYSTLLGSLRQDVVALVTRALVQERGVQIVYYSSSKGNKTGNETRTIFPKKLFSSGGAWYFRGFDVSKDKFRTFRFSRIAAANESDLLPPPNLNDSDWESPCILSLTPHPGHKQQEALRMDLHLEPGRVRNISTNKVLAGFILNELRVDCSLDGNLNPEEYPTRLLNLDELRDIESLRIAPGVVVK